MLAPRSAESGRISHLWWLMFGMAMAVYVVVMSIVGVAVLRRRARGKGLAAIADDPVDVEVDERTDHRFMLIGGLLVPLVIIFGVLLVRPNGLFGERRVEII